MFIVPLTHTARTFGQACSQPLTRSLDRLLDDHFADRWIGQSTPTQATSAQATTRTPALDVTETESSYVVTLDMPGAAKEDVKVAVEGRRITVQAEVLPAGDAKDGERVVYRERSASKFSRSFNLPAEVDQADSMAKINHGVLTLTLAKRSAAKSAHITVN